MSKKATGKKATVARKRGRPSTYSEATAIVICERIAVGESLASICRDPAMPSYTAISNWLDDHDDFSQRYARARLASADWYAEEIVSISDEPVEDAAQAQRNRLRVDARKWAAAKLKPQKYGERSVIAGPDGGPVQIASIQVVANLSPTEAAQIYRDVIAGNVKARLPAPPDEPDE